jgi:FKBP-type peptidyl-prolyl cis-trans isomerase
MKPVAAFAFSCAMSLAVLMSSCGTSTPSEAPVVEEKAAPPLSSSVRPVHRGQAQPARMGRPKHGSSRSADPAIIAAGVSSGRDGKPVLTVRPESSPPTQPALKVVAPGSGKPIRSGDAVSIRYTVAVWPDVDPYEAITWDAETPFTFVVGDPLASEDLSLAVRGMREGERRLALVPPGATSRDPALPKAKRDATLIYVVDVVDADGAEGMPTRMTADARKELERLRRRDARAERRARAAYKSSTPNR